MGKRGKGPKKDNKNLKRRTRDEYVGAEEDLDDDIDAFHKQRDKIPLDINGDVGESDEDNEQPVFDFEGIDDDEDEDDATDDDAQLTGLAAKIARQQKFLRAKMGGVEDEMHDEAEDEEDKRAVWGRRKDIYYNADNVDYELQSSDEELPAEEEAEVLRLQREKAKSLSMEDFGLDDVSQEDSDGEPTMEEILVKGKAASKSSEKNVDDDAGAAYEIEKDLNSLSREEQMDVVYSSAPELVGLLSELNDALEQLENRVNPLLCKVKEGKNIVKTGMHYLEVKQVLLLSYCQAITFYLLLKSEGESVRDHPVIARLVEIKSSLDKIKQLDENLPFQPEEILSEKHGNETEVKLVSKTATLPFDSSAKNEGHSLVSAGTRGTTMPNDTAKLVKLDSLKDHENRGEKRKRKNDQVGGVQSVEMLKVRAALEEKLKQKGVFSSNAVKPDKAKKNRLKPVNGQLEAIDDFDDDTVNVEGGARGLSNGNANSLPSNKLSQLVTTAKVKKPKIISGDDDLPMRDDIGERRRKHELRILAGAGINSEEDVEDSSKLEGDDNAVKEEDSGTEESEDDFYKQVKQQRAAKLAAKEEIYSRTSAMPSLPETSADGKRQITQQMEKNRGLTRARKKLTKNPRKKYKLKHQKAVVRRKGQVRDIKKPSGPYGGETSGINAGISRSVRFKN